MSQSVIDRNFGRLRSLATELSVEKSRMALYHFCRAMRRHEPNRYVPTDFGFETVVATLAASNALPRLERLHLSCGGALRPSHLTRLFDAFDLTRLGLRLTDSPSLAPSLEAIVGLPGFERVDVFDFGGQTSTSANVLLDLAAGRFELGPWLSGVATLFGHLANAPWEVPLRTLKVNSHQMSAHALAHIAAADRCARVESLGLSGWGLDAGDVEVFLRSWDATPTLDTLELSQFRFDVLPKLARVDRLKGLRVLHLSDIDLSEDGLDALDQAAHPASLRRSWGGVHPSVGRDPHEAAGVYASDAVQGSSTPERTSTSRTSRQNVS